MIAVVELTNLCSSMAGPDFWGPPCVMTLLWSASLYFIQRAIHHIGWITGTICILCTLQATYYYMATSFRDPGLVVQPKPCNLIDTNNTSSDDTNISINNNNNNRQEQRPPPPDRHHRWCDLCQAYQPPDGVHCPDCNVCVAGFDHHCAWMGCCIGQKNYKTFLRFNLAWLFYLFYAALWVGLFGPMIFRQAPAAETPHQQPQEQHTNRVNGSD